MHLPHQLLSATASLEKARIPLRRPSFKLIYSNVEHGFINLEAGGSGSRNERAGEVHFVWLVQEPAVRSGAPPPSPLYSLGSFPECGTRILHMPPGHK